MTIAVDRDLDAIDPARDQGGDPRGVWRTAAIFLVPYLVLGLAWAFSNPPSAAPDEPDHLVKALATARLEIGEPGPAAPADAPPIVQRNASIARVYDIPARLAPSGYACFAFNSDESAACLPHTTTRSTELVEALTPVGAYPPFLYLPIGLAAGLGTTPDQAFVLARLVVLAMSFGLLLLAAAHLIRWMGRSMLVGMCLVLTPMAVYTTAIVSLSAIELGAACAVAAVVVVAMRDLRSLEDAATVWTLAGAGATLALSRQLGVVTLVALLVLLVANVGPRAVVALVRQRPRRFVAAGLLVASSVLIVAWWELTYDRPSHVGSVVSLDAAQGFADGFYGIVVSAIGNFGWLDTPLPDVMIAAWVVLWIVVLGLGLLLGQGAGGRSLLAMLVVTITVAYAIYATVFHSIDAAAQGRHFTPIFSVCLLLAWGAILDRIRSLGASAVARLVVSVAGLAAVTQLAGVYWNGRRYATGYDGPLFYLSDVEWRPPAGWLPWLLAAVASSVLLAVTIVRLRRVPAPDEH